MSFSSKVKGEICRIDSMNKKEAMALLSAIMKVSGTLSFSGRGQIAFSVNTENAASARLVFKLLKEHLDIHTRIIMKRNSALKRANIYSVIINEDMGVHEVLKTLCITKSSEDSFELDYSIPVSMTSDDLYRKAYIRGAFLGGGSISNPEKAYHVEFVTHDEEYSQKFSELLNSYGLNSKVIQRKGSFVIYIKEGEHIVDLLNIIGAHNSLFYFENVRIMKEMRNNVNRLVNCETANLSKTVNAAVRQIESIKLIEKEIGFNRLSDNLKEIAELRLQYPDESLKELGEMLDPKVGKSGINHRLRKLEKIAEELRKEIL